MQIGFFRLDLNKRSRQSENSLRPHARTVRKPTREWKPYRVVLCTSPESYWVEKLRYLVSRRSVWRNFFRFGSSLRGVGSQPVLLVAYRVGEDGGGSVG